MSLSSTPSTAPPPSPGPDPSPWPHKNTTRSEAVLLDGWRQSVSFLSGEVVAVRSGHQTVPTFFGCHDKQVYVDPQELHRPVLASILQAGGFVGVGVWLAGGAGGAG